MYIPILALFLGTFCIGTTEFLAAGVLQPMAADLQVSIPTAGLLVTGYAAAVAIGGPIMTILLTRLPRKTAALMLMGLFIAGHSVIALGPTFEIVLLGRVITACGHGGFFGVAVVLASAAAPRERVGQALSIVFAGVTIANVVGVPIGTAVGGVLGWRTAVWLVAAVAVVSLAGIAAFVPSARGETAKLPPIAKQIRALGNQQVLTSYALIICMMLSLWGLNTFISPYLTEVVGLPDQWLAAALFASGLFATAGILIGGRLADAKPRETLRYCYPLLAVLYVLVLVLAPGNLLLGVLLVSLLPLPVCLVATAVQNRVLIGAKEAPDLASTLISSMFNIGTATGSWIAASSLANGLAYAQLPVISLTSAIIASAIALWITSRSKSPTGGLSGA